VIKCPECGEQVPREQICASCGCCAECCECDLDVDVDDPEDDSGVLEAT